MDVIIHFNYEVKADDQILKNADQIIVLDNRRIVERGTHNDLISQKGNYYYLVKNQLELGN